MGGQPAGKVAPVSRAGPGIGRAAALACANVGARAVASAGDASGGEETSRRMAAGAEGLGVRAAVSRAATSRPSSSGRSRPPTGEGFDGDQDGAALFRARQPLGRQGTPDEVAMAAA